MLRLPHLQETRIASFTSGKKKKGKGGVSLGGGEQRSVFERRCRLCHMGQLETVFKWEGRWHTNKNKSKKPTNLRAHVVICALWLLINDLQHQSTHRFESPETFPEAVLFISVALESTQQGAAINTTFTAVTLMANRLRATCFQTTVNNCLSHPLKKQSSHSLQACQFPQLGGWFAALILAFSFGSY